MAKRIKAYRKLIDELLTREMAKKEWEKLRTEHLTQVGFFQHERLIHLLVTLAFAVIAMMTFLVCITNSIPVLVILLIALLTLLIPYVRHYYLLENEVQAMYEQYDQIVQKLGGIGKTEPEKVIAGDTVTDSENEAGEVLPQMPAISRMLVGNIKKDPEK